MESLALTCGQVAEFLSYRRRDGSPDRRVVRNLAREGRIPPPIDREVALGHWRWSRTEIEAFVAGKWTPIEPWGKAS